MSPRRVLGIDIGRSEMKIVLLSKIAGSITVEAVKSVSLNAGTMLDDVVLDQNELARALRQSLANFGWGAINAVISVPTQEASLRWVSLPELAGPEHRTAASAKATPHLPYPADDAYLSVTPLQGTDEQGIGECLVIGVPKSILSSRAMAVERAGLRPVAAELEAQALLRVIERGLQRKSALVREASITMVDIGATTTGMSVVQGQKLQFLRSVRFGSNRIVKVVAEALGVSELLGSAILSDPEAKLAPDGVLSLWQEGKAIQVDLKSELDVLEKEIERLLRYFRSLHAERSYAGMLDYMILSGGFSNLNGLQEYLAENLSLRIEPLDPFAEMTLNLNQEAFRIASACPNSFAVATGLALSQFPTQEATHDVGNDFVWSRSA